MGVIVSDRDTINVYKFMEMCGLKCSIKKNIRVSHTIMLKKLKLRHSLFPSEVKIPTKVNYNDINNEDVKKGNIILVKDDYESRKAYINPIRFTEEISKNIEIMTEKERKRIRKNILKEYKKELEENEHTLKEGYIKYLVKKQNKMKDVEAFNEELEEEYTIENISRVKKYPTHSFGRCKHDKY